MLRGSRFGDTNDVLKDKGTTDGETKPCGGRNVNWLSGTAPVQMCDTGFKVGLVLG